MKASGWGDAQRGGLVLSTFGKKPLESTWAVILEQKGRHELPDLERFVFVHLS